MRLILGFILLVVMVVFALSNRQMIDLHIWPTDFAMQAPMSLTILVAMGVAFLVGALFTWFGSLAQRRRARRAEETVRLLEAQISALKARPPAPATRQVATRMPAIDA